MLLQRGNFTIYLCDGLSVIAPWPGGELQTSRCLRFACNAVPDSWGRFSQRRGMQPVSEPVQDLGDARWVCVVQADTPPQLVILSHLQS